MHLNFRELFTIRKLLTILIIVSGILVYWFYPPSLFILPRNVMLSWTGLPETTQTITWQTGRYIYDTKVEYREVSGQLPPLNVSGTVQPVETDKGTINVHSVTLTNLKPSTAYQYRVGDGVFWGRYHTFFTAPVKDQSFKFLLFGDSQGNSYTLWKSTLKAAYQANQEAAFMIMIGDLVDIGLNYSQWNEWFQAGQGIIDTIPVMPVMGNHETYTTQWTIAPPLLFTAFFRLPNNGPDKLLGKVYSFDYGNVHFSILDSQRQEEAEWIPDMLALQQAWLEKDLSQTMKRWKIVFIHRPIYHNRPVAGDEDLRETFAPIFDQYHVDVVFSGHDHIYARTYPLESGGWISEAGNGPVYITVGRSGKRTFARAEPREWDAVFYNPLTQPNYLTVEVTNNKLQMTAVNLNGELIDVWSRTLQ